MPTVPKTATSGKSIEPSKPVHQCNPPSTHPSRREMTLHSTGRKDNDESLFPAVQPVSELETVPRMRRGFHPVPIKVRDKLYLRVSYYSRITEQDLGLCEYPFAVREECLHGADCLWQHHPLTPEELEKARGMFSNMRAKLVTDYFP
jgi:hypothetical protein